MRFLIISHTEHVNENGRWYAYSPYVREMNLWLNHIDAVEIVAPLCKSKVGLNMAYAKEEITVNPILAINLTTPFQILRSFFLAPFILIKMMVAMQRADHIHLRCPGNIGLLGCIAQIFFPLKAKTAKYAGNWDPKSKQPWSYRLQKWFLSNEKLTKNMQVLVYGEWPNQSKNIKSFFTATYSEVDKTEIPQRKYDLPLRFLFVGTLVKGKGPDYALNLVKELVSQGISSELHFYGDGPLRNDLEEKIKDFRLERSIFIHGNQNTEALKKAYESSHFLLLPSKSEGWPKVVAEAMWWGVIPVVTRISCLPWMLGNMERGILIYGDLKEDIAKIKIKLGDEKALCAKSYEAKIWSRQYTLESFETEIKKLL